jgi:sugar lactone lactonase YvrE
VVGVAPDGMVVGKVLVRVEQVSACAFGGQDMQTLHITSAGAGSAEAGALFAARMVVPGAAIPPFAGIWAPAPQL